MVGLASFCVVLVLLCSPREAFSNRQEGEKGDSSPLWTNLPRTHHPSGVPLRTSSPSTAFEIAQRDGAAVLTGVNTNNAADVSATSLQVFGEALVAIQSPIHVGTNNFGFKGGTPITNQEARPAHVDTIIQYKVSPYEAPDFFLLCARTPSSSGGGESFLTDLPAATHRMTKESRDRLHEMEIIQKIDLPPDYDKLSEANTTQQTTKQHNVSEKDDKPHERIEKFVVSNRVLPHRPAYRVSSFSDADSLLAHMTNTTNSATPPAIRASPSSPDPSVDLQTTLDYLQAVSEETSQAGRFRLEAGDCAVVDNYRVAHGREPYEDLNRALWQIWAWTNESIAVPETAGPNREWAFRRQQRKASDGSLQNENEDCGGEAIAGARASVGDDEL